MKRGESLDSPRFALSADGHNVLCLYFFVFFQAL